MKKRLIKRWYSQAGYLLLLFWILSGTALAQKAEIPIDKNSYTSPVPQTGQTNSWSTGDDGDSCEDRPGRSGEGGNATGWPCELHAAEN